MRRRDPTADLGVSSSERLSGLGLPPVTQGWVPQPLVPFAEEPVVETVEIVDPQPPAAATPPTVGGLARDWLRDRVPLSAQGLVERLSFGSVATALAAVVVLVLGGSMLLHRHSSAGYSPSYSTSDAPVPTAAYPTPSEATTDDASSIVVDVGGRVRKPGLVTLPAGARVADAIAAAGGPLRHREIATIDLAARVTDGQLLLIGVKAPAATPDPAAASGTPSSSAPVALNSATLEQLETLPGIGPVTGQKILDWRTAHSGFTSIEQLQDVSGIGPATYAELSPLVTL